MALTTNLHRHHRGKLLEKRAEDKGRERKGCQCGVQTPPTAAPLLYMQIAPCSNSVQTQEADTYRSCIHLALLRTVPLATKNERYTPKPAPGLSLSWLAEDTTTSTSTVQALPNRPPLLALALPDRASNVEDLRESEGRPADVGGRFPCLLLPSLLRHSTHQDNEEEEGQEALLLPLPPPPLAVAAAVALWFRVPLLQASVSSACWDRLQLQSFTVLSREPEETPAQPFEEKEVRQTRSSNQSLGQGAGRARDSQGSRRCPS